MTWKRGDSFNLKNLNQKTKDLIKSRGMLNFGTGGANNSSTITAKNLTGAPVSRGEVVAIETGGILDGENIIMNATLCTTGSRDSEVVVASRDLGENETGEFYTSGLILCRINYNDLLHSNCDFVAGQTRMESQAEFSRFRIVSMNIDLGLNPPPQTGVLALVTMEHGENLPVIYKCTANALAGSTSVTVQALKADGTTEADIETFNKLTNINIYENDLLYSGRIFSEESQTSTLNGDRREILIPFASGRVAITTLTDARFYDGSTYRFPASEPPPFSYEGSEGARVNCNAFPRRTGGVYDMIICDCIFDKMGNLRKVESPRDFQVYP